MAMIVGVPSETAEGEKRVALDPSAAAQLVKAGVTVKVQSGAGAAAGFPDAGYELAGAQVAADRAAAFDVDVVLQVRAAGANDGRGGDDLGLMRSGQIVVGHAEPLTAHEMNRQVAERGVSLLAMELIPRITRAQSMDALSSQANLAGYKGVILAADTLPQMFPLMMTAAGTIQPARVFVIGAGVAGLQAIATAKRLGAVVSAIDVRPEVREQVESLGAKFVAPPELIAGEKGYAREQSEEQKAKQREMMAATIAESDVVVTTANIPGRKAPVLVTAEQVRTMKPGSVIVDLAAERGGNCELTRVDQTYTTENGVTIIGIANVPALVARDASRMYGRNIVSLLKHLMGKAESITLNPADEITAGTLVCREGQIVHPAVRKAMGMEPFAAESAAAESAPSGGQADAAGAGTEGSGG